MTEEILSLAKTFMKQDAFVRHIGVELVELTADKCICRLPVTPETLNGVGVAQGGAIFTLADYACACIVVVQGHPAPTTNASITFISAGSGILTAEADLVRVGKTLAHAKARVTDDQGHLVATYSATFFRITERTLDKCLLPTK